jgi:hypothetical protein
MLAQWTGTDTPSWILSRSPTAARHRPPLPTHPDEQNYAAQFTWRPIPNADHVRDPHRILDGWPPPRADSPRPPSDSDTASNLPRLQRVRHGRGGARRCRPRRRSLLRSDARNATFSASRP